MDIYGEPKWEPSSNRILVPKGVRKDFGVRILNLRVLFATLLPQSPSGDETFGEFQHVFMYIFLRKLIWFATPGKNLHWRTWPLHCRSQKLRQLHSQLQRWQRFQRWRTLTRQGVDVGRGFGWNGWQLIVYTMQIYPLLLGADFLMQEVGGTKFNKCDATGATSTVEKLWETTSSHPKCC